MDLRLAFVGDVGESVEVLSPCEDGMVVTVEQGEVASECLELVAQVH